MRPALVAHRARLARFLTEHGQVWQPGTGDQVWDPNKGAYVDPPPTVAWAGACLVRPQQRDVQIVQAGTTGYTYAQYRYDVTFPAETAVDRTMWLILDACEYEPALVGLRLNIVDVPLDAWAVARRVVAELATN